MVFRAELTLFLIRAENNDWDFQPKAVPMRLNV